MSDLSEGTYVTGAGFVPYCADGLGDAYLPTTGNKLTPEETKTEMGCSPG